MKKLLGILSILLLGTTSSFGMYGCVTRGNNLPKTNEYTAEANQDIETFYEIITLIKKKIKTWWDSKGLIDTNNFNDIAKFNEFITTLKPDELQTFIGAEISKWSFLEHLINDFKKEINNINNELVNTYDNFYRKIEKALILSKTLDIYKKNLFYWLFNKLIFLKKPIFYKVFYKYQDFSTKLKKNSQYYCQMIVLD